MKILYVDSAINGHHSNYIKALYEDIRYDSVILLPEEILGLKCKQYIYKLDNEINKSYRAYCSYIDEICRVAKQEQPDIIHILTGDIFRKYAGMRLNRLKKYKTIVTMHQLPDKFTSKLGALFTAKQVNDVVVHSEYLKNFYTLLGVKNVHTIIYPSFGISRLNKNEAKRYFNLNCKTPVVLALGETRYDKGLDILISALNEVNNDFQLLITGKEDYFTQDYIKETTVKIKEKTFLFLRYLTDTEMNMAINAADIVVVPYRKRFNATSGPMNDGVWLEKCIIGPNHGNLGKTISMNHLGWTFESENAESLSRTLDSALSNSFSVDDAYTSYKNMLSINKFKESYYAIYKEMI